MVVMQLAQAGLRLFFRVEVGRPDHAFLTLPFAGGLGASFDAVDHRRGVARGRLLGLREEE
jgi:hypothetical protein